MGHIKNVNDIYINDLIPKDSKIIDIKAKGHRNYVVLNDGRVFTWPFDKSKVEIITKPYELKMPFNVKISSVSCGFNFIMLLTNHGMIYSYGSDNTEG